MKISIPLKTALSTTMIVASFIFPSQVKAEEDVVKLSCSEETSKIHSPFGKATATCHDSTSPAPNGWAYFRDEDTRVTRLDGHHDRESCDIAYRDEFKVSVTLPGGNSIEIPGFRRVELNGRAKAEGAGRTARITCEAQAIRTKVN